MTKRLWIVTACGILTWSVNVRAQSGAPNPREPLASQYVNAETGITLAEAITRALAQEPTLRATRTEVDVARGEQLQAGSASQSHRVVHAADGARRDRQPEPDRDAMAAGPVSQDRTQSPWPIRNCRRREQGVADRERLLAADVRMKYGEVVAAVRDLSISDDLVAATTRQSESAARAGRAGRDPTARTQHGGSRAAPARGRAAPAGRAGGSSRDRAETSARHEGQRAAPAARLARRARDARSGPAAEAGRDRRRRFGPTCRRPKRASVWPMRRSIALDGKVASI